MSDCTSHHLGRFLWTCQRLQAPLLQRAAAAPGWPAPLLRSPSQSPPWPPARSGWARAAGPAAPMPRHRSRCPRTTPSSKPREPAPALLRRLPRRWLARRAAWPATRGL